MHWTDVVYFKNTGKKRETIIIYEFVFIFVGSFGHFFKISSRIIWCVWNDKPNNQQRGEATDSVYMNRIKTDTFMRPFNQKLDVRLSSIKIFILYWFARCTNDQNETKRKNIMRDENRSNKMSIHRLFQIDRDEDRCGIATTNAKQKSCTTQPNIDFCPTRVLCSFCFSKISWNCSWSLIGLVSTGRQ